MLGLSGFAALAAVRLPGKRRIDSDPDASDTEVAAGGR